MVGMLRTSMKVRAIYRAAAPLQTLRNLTVKSNNTPSQPCEPSTQQALAGPLRLAIRRSLLLAAMMACGATTPALAQIKAAPMTWATFGNPVSTLQGGSINGFSYSEKPGDVIASPMSVVAGMLFVRGSFVAKNASAWSGLGVSVEHGTNKAIDVSNYKTLSIRLSALYSSKLRLRLNGTDDKTKSNGCYPIFVQYVTPEERSYEIPLSKFASDSYCGANAVDVAKMLQRLSAIEVAETSDPVRARNSQFTIASITLLP